MILSRACQQLNLRRKLYGNEKYTLAAIVVQLALLLVITDVAQSTSDDQDTGEARCYHSPEKVRVYNYANGRDKNPWFFILISNSVKYCMLS